MANPALKPLELPAKPPMAFVCSMTSKIMESPVLSLCSHLFDASVIEPRRNCPIDNFPLDVKTCIPLGNLKKEIETWRAHQAGLTVPKRASIDFPRPVRRVTIPKPNGKGSRLLGIPCVLDRFIQQALLQVIQPVWDPKFSEHSYGFRPGRSAHQAIAEAQKYLEMGYEYVVDIDLEKFFDRVSHDRLMSKLTKEIEDKRALKLIRSYLNAGVMVGGLTSPTTEGVPQGSPLSPFLSNVVLGELDKELEARGHKHVRYGDDCNIYVKSKRAGERVKESITRFIEKRLKLRVNEDKSAVDCPRKRKFLGFTFTGGKQPNRRQIAPESIARFKVRIRQLTRRNRGISMEERIDELSKYMKGWRGYFGYCETSSVFKELDGWIRRRLRCVYWKQWKTFKKRRKELIKRGIKETDAVWTAMSPRGPWLMSHIPQLRRALSIKYFDEIGLPKLAPV